MTGVKMVRNDAEVWEGEIAPGTFAFEDSVIPRSGERCEFLRFMCPIGKATCGVHVAQKPHASGSHVWQWDGNRDAPTLSPSINCGYCGWHGFISAGEMQKA